MMFMYVLPSFSLITRSIHQISVEVKRTELVNASILLPTMEAPSVV